MKTLEQLVEEAVAKRAVGGAVASTAGLESPFLIPVARSLEVPGAPNLSCAHKVRSGTFH